MVCGPRHTISPRSPGGQRAILLVEHRDLDDREGAAAGADAIMILGLQASDDHRAFGLTVGLREDAAKPVFGALRSNAGAIGEAP